MTCNLRIRNCTTDRNYIQLISTDQNCSMTHIFIIFHGFKFQDVSSIHSFSIMTSLGEWCEWCEWSRSCLLHQFIDNKCPDTQLLWQGVSFQDELRMGFWALEGTEPSLGWFGWSSSYRVTARAFQKSRETVLLHRHLGSSGHHVHHKGCLLMFFDVRDYMSYMSYMYHNTKLS